MDDGKVDTRDKLVDRGGGDLLFFIVLFYVPVRRGWLVCACVRHHHVSDGGGIGRLVGSVVVYMSKRDER